MHQKRLLKNENFKPWIISVQEPVAIWIQIEFANLINSIQNANSIRDSIANSMQQQLAKFVTNYEPLFFLRFKFLKP